MPCKNFNLLVLGFQCINERYFINLKITTRNHSASLFINQSSMTDHFPLQWRVGLLKARLRLTKIGENFKWFHFCSFSARSLVYIFCPSVLSTSNLVLHKTQAMDNSFVQEKLSPQLTFNPGLALTGFRTTRPRKVKSAHEHTSGPSGRRLGVFLLPPGWDASPLQGYFQH